MRRHCGCGVLWPNRAVCLVDTEGSNNCKNASIRACEVLNRINLAEREAAKNEQPENPITVLEQIARHSPELAHGLATERGIDWTPPDLEHARRCPTCQRYLVPGV